MLYSGITEIVDLYFAFGCPNNEKSAADVHGVTALF
jgi:hypothetical protein